MRARVLCQKIRKKDKPPVRIGFRLGGVKLISLTANSRDMLFDVKGRSKMADETRNKDVFIDGLLDLAGQTAIAHHIPGRIRLKVKLPGWLLAQDFEAGDLMKYFMGIVDVRTNAAARSVVISYDTGAIAPDLWERLVNCKKDPSLRSSVKEELGRLSRPEIDQGGPQQL
jgi:hypothetical protein